jgi:hypothetical protein
MKRLWEIDHPYYGADGYSTKFDSFAELRAAADAMDEDMNHIYRWDWVDYSQPHHDNLMLNDAERAKQEFRIFAVMPRKSAFLEWSCPITHDQEIEVLEWLRGPRVLGALRTLWEPLLAQDPEEVTNLRAELAAVRNDVMALLAGDFMPTPTAILRALYPSPEVSS